MKVLVTGGGGFLGSNLCRKLLTEGFDVLAVGRRRYPELEAQGIECRVVDLRDGAAVDDACRHQDVVFHVGAMAGIWGPRRQFWETNVDGTRHVIDACRRHNVGRLVYTSSPSVVFGEEELCGVTESQPYPSSYLATYPETKALAERMVLDANGPALTTVALRPHLIWGPGDPHLLPRVVDRARRGQLRQVGDGRNLVDIIYIDNAVEAHTLAAAALNPQAACAGRAYFISQGEPVLLWPWLNDILVRVGVQPVHRSVSYSAARRVGAVLEFAYRLGRLRAEPKMTRFLAAQLAKSHYFDISAARQDLGYYPKVSTATGVQRVIPDLMT
jgi:nucleoside-diphosphate-sugar epimerase